MGEGHEGDVCDLYNERGLRGDRSALRVCLTRVSVIANTVMSDPDAAVSVLIVKHANIRDRYRTWVCDSVDEGGGCSVA